MSAGPLVIIGGRENRGDKPTVLEAVARFIGSGKLCIATIASGRPTEVWNDYRQIFKRLGVKRFSHLEVDTRRDAVSKACLKALSGVDGVFFTGGDQLRITSEIGGTDVADKIFSLHAEGALIAGTSAGAAVMSEVMVSAPLLDPHPTTGMEVHLSPGLGLLKNVLIDQHFAERGRIGRLIGAVIQNPRLIGLGINEDTAVVATSARHLQVIGSGAVYIIDLHDAVGSDLTDENPSPGAVFEGRFHILAPGDHYDLQTRRPKAGKKKLTDGKVSLSISFTESRSST